MPWSAIVPLIIQFGIPLAEQIWKNVTSGKDVTQADWDSLKALASQTAADRMRANLVAAGIPLDSEQAKTLIALAS
jgi:hypothetical protein